MKFFKRRPKKYVFYLLKCNEQNVNEKLTMYQDHGWEIGGDIENTYNHSFGSTSIQIPLKKLVK